MLFRHSNSPVLPGHRPASLGGFCVSRVSFLQKKLRERRGANRHPSGQLAEIFLIRREFLTDATEITGGLGSRHGCACIRRKIYRGNGPRMRDGRTWRVGNLCPAAGGCRAVCCFGWSYLPNHHVGGRYRLLRSCGRSSNRLRKWRSGSMGEAATTVRCVGGAEAPKVRRNTTVGTGDRGQSLFYPQPYPVGFKSCMCSRVMSIQEEYRKKALECFIAAEGMADPARRLFLLEIED
jgi:hypothetical protein